MGKINITQEELLEKYVTYIDELTDECDWITYISGEMVCGAVISILLSNNITPSMTSEELYKIYDKKIKSLKLKGDEWHEKYGVPEIIDMVYKILENK